MSVPAARREAVPVRVRLDGIDRSLPVWAAAALALPTGTIDHVIEDVGRLATLDHVGPLMARMSGRTSS